MPQKETSNIFEMIVDTADGAGASAVPSSFRPPENWHEAPSEGQLAVDVADDGANIVVISTMAGAERDRIEVYVHNDLLTIRGSRQSPLAGGENVQYFCQECFWGIFSRTIVLPEHVKGDLARAEYKGGVLTVRIPKQRAQARIPITVIDE